MNLNEIHLTDLKVESNTKGEKSNDIAIIGMACEFPNARNKEEFWENLKNERTGITEIPYYRKLKMEEYFSCINKTDYVFCKGGYLDRIDQFDWSFFNIPPNEARLWDPNQRLFLQIVWKALEDAGYGGEKLKGSNTGIYLGFSNNNQYKTMINRVVKKDDMETLTGNIPSIIASRIAYILDLKGPSMLIDTACSSSLVALHQACQGILSGDCEYAVAGGIKTYILSAKKENSKLTGIESSTFKTRTFDEESDGTVAGEGVVALLLKPFNKALQDNDLIYAVIKGSAVNQDGSTNGITAPSALAQEEVIVKALEKANIDPTTITYIEAHGTGTKLGDPIEIYAIKKAFERYSNRKQFCGIGSLKTNIGHLDTAAGLASIAKMVMSLKNKQIPASLNFSRPNSNIVFEDSPVYVVDRLTDWNTNKGTPRRCGVNSFGLSGTNCHVILEEAPNTINQTIHDELTLFVLSAKKEEGIISLINEYRSFLGNQFEFTLQDIGYTISTGRGHYECRLAIIVDNLQKLKTVLEQFDRIENLENKKVEPNTVFYGKHKVVKGNASLISKYDISEHKVQQLSDTAQDIIERILNHQIEKTEAFYQLAELYCKGANINWEKLYLSYLPCKKVSLPTYPFQKTSCWVELMNYDKKAKEMLYTISWITKKLECKNVLNKGKIIVIKQANCRRESVIRLLIKQGYDVLEVEIGTNFQMINESHYSVDGSYNDFVKLLRNIKDTVELILYMPALSAKEVNDLMGLQQSQETNFFYLINFMKGLNTIQEKRNQMECILFTEYAHRVNDKDSYIKPENALLCGLGKVINKEYNYLKARMIDLDDTTSSQNIVDEILSGTMCSQVAYRKNKRYVPIFKHVEKVSYTENIELKKDGVYIITGGLGGLGLEVGKFLASQTSIKLALLSRSNLPERQKWDEIIEEGRELKTIHRINSIKAMERLGAQVYCYCVDVTNLKRMTTVFDGIRKTLNQINGIIHMAGVAGSGLILDKTKEKAKEVLAPKIEGTWILDQLTRQDNLDFLILFSSLTTVTGGVGQSDYTAANAFMDAYGSYRNNQGFSTKVIDWSAWKEVGMASKNFMEDEVFRPLLTREAVSAFKQIFGTSTEQVIVCNLNFNTDINLSQLLQVKLSDELIKKASTQQFSTQIKKEVLEIKEEKMSTKDYILKAWKKVFGFEKVEINQDFFEVGGNSISALQITKLLRDYNLNVEVGDILTYTTIKDLAEYIDKTIDGNNFPVSNSKIESTIIDSSKKTKLENYINKKNSGNEIEIQEIYKVSPSQERMLFYSLFYKNSSIFSQQITFRIKKQIDIVLLEEAINEVIKRHSILRTNFTYKKLDYPVQFVLKTRKIKVEYRNLADYAGNVFEEVEQIKKEGNKQIFDLLTDCLFHIQVIETIQDGTFIILNYHHIIMDGWCTSIIFHEVQNIYCNLKNNKKAYCGLPQAIPYKVYIDWIEQQELSEGICFWKEKLKDYVIKKKSNRSVLSGNEKEIKEELCSLSEDYTKQLNEYCKRNKLTISSVINTVFCLIWSELFQITDIVSGVVVSGRPIDLEQSAQIVGLFANVIPLRIKNIEEKEFQQIAHEIQEYVMNSNRFNYMSIMDIQEACGYRENLLEYVIATENYEQSINPLLITEVECHENTNYDLNIMVIPAEKLTIRMNYNNLVYSRQFMKKLHTQIREQVEKLIIKK